MKALLTTLCLLTLSSAHAMPQDNHRQREQNHHAQRDNRTTERNHRQERPEQRRDDQQANYRHDRQDNNRQPERRSYAAVENIKRDDRLQNHITGKSFSRGYTPSQRVEAPRHYSSERYRNNKHHHHHNPLPVRHHGSITRHSDYGRHNNYVLEKRHYRQHIYNHHHHPSYHRHFSHGVHYDAAYLLGGIIIGALIADVGTADGYYYTNGSGIYSYSVLRPSGWYESFYRNGERILMEVSERYCRAY